MINVYITTYITSKFIYKIGRSLQFKSAGWNQSSLEWQMDNEMILWSYKVAGLFTISGGIQLLTRTP